MTNILFAYLDKSNIPTRESWQHSINELNFGVALKLPTDLEVLTDGAICKCMLSTNKTNEEQFELYNGKVEWNEESDKYKYMELAGKRDYYFMLKSHGTVGSNVCMCMVCYALLIGFDAVISYDGIDTNAYSSLEKTTRDLLVKYENA